MRYRFVFAALLACSVIACAKPNPDGRDKLASDLTERLGKAAKPNVGFLRDSTHLQINLDSAYFGNATDSAYDVESRRIAQFAMARYERATLLDSITVLERSPRSPGAWKIIRQRTFPAPDTR